MKLTSEEGRELERWVRSWSPSRAVTDMVRCSMARIAVKELGRIRAKMSGGSTPLWAVLSDHDTAQHIVDWMTASFSNSEEWIDRVDEQGRPLKLMKCGSYEQLMHEADKAMRKRLQGQTAGLGENDEIAVAELEDGYRIIRLLTPKALDVESSRMQHCVGQGAYDWHVKQGVIEILSLRDPAGNPHVTMEVSDNGRMLRQIKGKQNRRPDDRYMQSLKPFARSVGWRNGDLYWPTVRDIHGNVYDTDGIPAGAIFETLSCVNAADLPERLTVRGDLRLRPLRERETVPGDLRVGGLILCDGPADRFPAHLRDKVMDPWGMLMKDWVKEFGRAVQRVGSGLAEAWSEIDFRIDGGRQTLCRDPRREPDPVNLTDGSRMLLGASLPHVPQAQEDDHGREDGWRNPRDRCNRPLRRYTPQAAGFDELMRAYQREDGLPIRISVLPEEVANVLEQGVVPVAADFYPRRRRRPEMTAQLVPLDESVGSPQMSM